MQPGPVHGHVAAPEKYMNSQITKTDEAKRLLEGLEIMRDELGPLAEELIELLRESGVAPDLNHDQHNPNGYAGRKH